MSAEQLPRETFPGGDVVPREDELRVTIDKKAYAEILSHAKEEPEFEICGVLIGKLKEDKHGPWLDIRHTIRGEGAKQQGAQVTFTHEAWNHINKVWDRDYPQLGIVGWYHTHPGFDIFLSDMDKFIHNSYFNNPSQVAYVYDPHQGTEGFFRKPKDEIVQIDRYWHGGKPRKIVYPEQRAKAASGAPAGAGGAAPNADALGALSNRVTQLEMELRTRQGGWLSNVILIVVMALVVSLMLFQQLRPRRMMLIHVDPVTGTRLNVEVFPEPADPMAPADPGLPKDPNAQKGPLPPAAPQDRK